MINDRLKQVIDQLFDGNASKFASKIGYTQGQIANYISARMSVPRSDFIENVLTSIDVLNADWLMTGRGEMLIKDQLNCDKNALINHLKGVVKEKNSRIEQLLIEVGELRYYAEGNRYKVADNEIKYSIKMKAKNLCEDLEKQGYRKQTKKGVDIYSKNGVNVKFVLKGRILTIEDEKGEVLFETLCDIEE